MALIQEQGSLLLHCPEENGKEHELNSEGLLQEQGAGPTYPADISLFLTYSTDRCREGQGNNSSSSPAQPASSSYYSTGMLQDRGKAQTHPPQEPGQKVSCPCLITVRELFHIITTIQHFLFLPFLFFLAFAL